MEFQLSNEGESTSGTPAPVTNDDPNQPPLSLQNNDADNRFEESPEESVYIADQYQRPADATVADIGAGTYLSQKTTFSPFLMYLGVALQVLGLIFFIYQLHRENITLESILYSSAVVSITTSVGLILLIVDAVLMNTKKCGGPSLIAWALLLPYVYYFKRCKANGDSVLIAVAILVVLIGLSIFAYLSFQQVFTLLLNSL